ncbi:MAG: hypothetical protein IVW57_14820, partial [Ktedonobacterales bacterium]|nr:hypothetical protein [Ktedonobacterales bacterium]
MTTQQDIERALRVLHPTPGEVYEIRALHTPRRGTVSGYYGSDDIAMCAADVAKALDGQTPAVYTTLNPVEPDVRARANNHLKNFARETTGDHEILGRRWLPIDLDPVRPAGISSTDAEHAAALAKALDVAEFLEGLGWPAPVRGDSGNGAHLLYRVDLPARDDGRVGRVLKALAALFADPDGVPVRVEVDASVHNAGRIWKIYGTQVRKGDPLPGRPHRRAALLSVPESIDVVTREQLDALIAEFAPPPAESRATPGAQNGHYRGRIADMGAWLADHGITTVVERRRDYGTTWVLERCVWNSDHTDRSAWVISLPRARG